MHAHLLLQCPLIRRIDMLHPRPPRMACQRRPMLGIRRLLLRQLPQPLRLPLPSIILLNLLQSLCVGLRKRVGVSETGRVQRCCVVLAAAAVRLLLLPLLTSFANLLYLAFSFASRSNRSLSSFS